MPKERSLITNKKDVRKANDTLVLQSMTNTNEKNYVKTAPSLKGLQSKNLLPVEKQASKNFFDWYSDPATKQKFQKNTGLDPSRTQDLIAKGLQTPMVKYDESVSHAAPLGSSSEAEFRSPYVIKSIGDNLHQKTGYISYRPQSNNNYTSGLLNHELTHASGFDNVLAPALYRSLGLKLPEKTHGGLNYMDRPEEVYGNFHEFRQQLGLKPGQKVDTNSLNKMVKDSKINNNFWRTFSSDEAGKENEDRIGKIANAINTIASVKDNNQNMNYSAYGGEINNKLNPKYNNYLNMRQYAQGGNLTRFDEGGTHESSPLGGIPQGVAPDGKQNTVEQGESKKGNFIYSNRIALDKSLVKQFNLPSYVANKSVSDASKAIDDKFKHRADKYAQETKNTLLDRLSQAQEYLKQQEQSQLEQTNQSMQANSQQVPDMMNGQVPEGMEEYSQQESQQGQEMQDPQNIQTTSPIAAFGGYQQHRYSGFDNPNSEMNVARPQLSSVSEIKPAGLVPLQGATLSAPGVPDSAGKIPTSATPSAGPGAGAVIGAAGTAMDLGQLAFGKAAQDTSGLAASGRVGGAGMIGGSAIKGAAAGAGFGPLGAAIGGGVGLLAGIAGLGKARAAETKNTTNFALNTNSQFQDQHAYGGMLGGDPPKKIRNSDGSYSYVNTTTRQVTPGSKGTTIPGTPGKPAVLPSTGGVNATDPGRNKAFAQARAAGLPTFNYNGKVYNTNVKLATPGVPAVNPTPDIVTPSIPPTYETNTTIEPIPSQVYNVQAQRGTAGTGVLRPGVGGGITTNNQYTANKDVANRAINAQQLYNADVNRRYAPVTDDGRSNNSAQIANRNAKAELRRQQLQGTATATEIPTQLGLERKKVEALRTADTFAYGGKMNQMGDGGRILPKPPTADYDTNSIQNLHDSLGITSNTPGYGKSVGPNTLKAYQNFATDYMQKRGYLTANPKSFPNIDRFYKDGKVNLPNEGEANALGLTREGYKYNPLPIEPINTGDPIITPTQTQAGFEAYADAKQQAVEDSKFSNKASKFIGENIGDAMRLAPVAMNAYQLKNLQKPTGFQYETLANRYKPQYVDEAQMQRIVDQEGNNTMSAIGQMGGSEGATRNAILAMGLNKTKGLSDAYANAAAQNRAQDAQAQQFNLGVDAQNVATRNRAIDEMRADKGAYDSAKSKFLSSIGTDIGDIGKEKNASDAAIAMFGYTRKGKYVIDKQGNIVSPETLAKRQADFLTYISEQNKKDNK